MNPVLISKQNSTTFSDKPQIWADNAASSPFFGDVYVCWASFRGQEKGNAAPVPLTVARSADGGGSWTQKQVGPATSNGVNSQPDGCTSAPTATATCTCSAWAPGAACPTR